MYSHFWVKFRKPPINLLVYARSPHSVFLLASMQNLALSYLYIPVTLQLLQPFPPYFLVVVLDLDISVVRKKESTEEEKAIKATSLQKGGVPIIMMQPARQKRDEYIIFTEKLYSVDSGFNCSNR